MQLSVIISTYNSPDWLQKVLWGYQMQTFRDFEMVIADDGSTDDTRKIIDKAREEFSLPIQHIWHEDKGFRKCTILNKAITASKADYLVMSDGDCVPRKDFLEVHVNKRKHGFFLSGGYSKLPLDLSKKITKENIFKQECFDIHWLKANGLPSGFKNTKFIVHGWQAAFANFITPSTPTFNGHNSSAWKKDIYNVNGFNEEMRYGALDRELGDRLENNGTRGLQIRYSAICVHLDHPRVYKNKKDLANNRAIWNRTRKERIKWAAEGIIKAGELKSGVVQ